MKIMVIDDSPWNVASAKLTLNDHDLTVVDSIEAAYQLLASPASFDAVLTDLFMPVGQFRGAMDVERYGPAKGEIPAGLVFAIHAANKGIRTVLCTDTNHHADWLCSLLDILGMGGDLRQRRIAYVEARCVPVQGCWDEKSQKILLDRGQSTEGPCIKNWLEVMRYSCIFPEFPRSFPCE